MSEKLQIPHSFKRVSDAIKIHLKQFESLHQEDFTFAHEREGFGIEYFRFRFARRGYELYEGSADLGRIRIRQLNTNLTEMVMEDSSRLNVGPDLFLKSSVIRMWEDEEGDLPAEVPLKKRKAQAATKFKRFRRVHEEVRETVIEGLKEDHLLLGEEKITATRSPHSYVDKSRIARLRQLRSSSFDLQRLIRFCEELNKCAASNSFCAIAALVRAVIDHVPPIFGARTFAEVANNFTERSVKVSLQRLDTSSRNIANSVLHQQIRRREVMPNGTQVNFSNDLDILLGEIIAG